MNTEERWFPGHLREVDTAECWELLTSREVGRVAYADDHGPMVVPVTYLADDGTLLFRVTPYSDLARHLPGSRAAFEVDDVDYFTRSGWSVILRGDVTTVDDEELPSLHGRLTPWPEGQRSLYLRLTPDTVTGRRLLEA
jgi:nitroimidazol reductase NimA-like FMN-containing flavoprotein (pyridoxamine 5'-phosphate oxidase superfamily)